MLTGSASMKVVLQTHMIQGNLSRSDRNAGPHGQAEVALSATGALPSGSSRSRPKRSSDAKAR